MTKKISDKDKKDWEDFLSSDERLTDKDFNSILKTKKDVLTFDLHGYSLNEANKKVKDLINSAFEKHIRKLIIVTGKGLHSQHEKNPYVAKDLGILKNSVPEFIKNDIELMSKINGIQEANTHDGGSGAFYIYVKKKIIK